MGEQNRRCRNVCDRITSFFCSFVVSDVDRVAWWMILQRGLLLGAASVILFIGIAVLWQKGLVWSWEALWQHLWSPVLVLCLCVIVLRKCLMKKKTIVHTSLPERECPQVSDSPIGCAKDDLFSRGAYVQMLCTLVMGGRSIANSKGARFIGIYAPWGDGKTSVRNLLEERINLDYGQGSVVFVDFAPWKYQSAEVARLVLFEKISKEIAGAGNDGVAFLFKRLASLVSLQRLDRSAGAIHDVIDWMRRLWFTWVMPEERILDALRTLLMQLTSRVVVVVDDLDRLPHDDVNSIIRFLKANGDLPNITYLILADEDYLAAAVSKMVERPDKFSIEAGREYLEKIIPIRCPLPAINGWRIFDEFKNSLEQMLRDYAITVDDSFDGCDWVLPYLGNARQSKRLLNAFSVQLATLKKKLGGRAYLNVHIGDLLVLTALRTFEHKFYEAIWDGYMGMLANSWHYFEDDKGMSVEWMEEHFYKHVKTEHRPRVEKFLSDRLGVISSGGGVYDQKPKTYRLANARDPALLLNYRLASEYCFQNYFLMEIEDAQLPQDEMEHFLAEIQQCKIPEEQLKELDKRGQLPFLLFALESVKTFKTRDVSACYMRTLIRLATWRLRPVVLPDKYESGFGIKFSVYVRIYRCLLFYCQDVKSEIMRDADFVGVKRVGKLLLPLLQDEGDVVISAHMIRYDLKHHRASGVDWDAFFDDEEYEELKKFYLEEIGRLQKSDGLFHHPEFFDLFRCWMNLLREYDDVMLYKKFGELCASVVDDGTALCNVMKFFADDNRLSGAFNKLVVSARLDELCNHFGEPFVEKILNRMETMRGLDEYDSKFRASLRWAMNCKKQGLPYGREDQEKHFKEG